MADPATARPTSETPRTAPGAAVRWLLVGAIGLTAMSLVSAHAPPQIKWLGLFAIIYGLSAGLFLGKVAEALGVHSRRLVLAGSLLLIAAGEFGLTLEAFRVYREAMIAEVIEAGLRDPRAEVPGAEAAHSESVRRAAESLLAERIRLKDYLASRTKVKRDAPSWPEPWPVVLWSGELVAGTVAGAWFARSLVKSTA